MGFKYEVQTFFYESDDWITGYQGQSLFKAIIRLQQVRRQVPGRCYRLVIR